jgi:hypothetical protein
MGLGSVNDLGLADARDKAYCNRTLILQGVDPIESRRIKKSKRRLEAAHTVTFRTGMTRNNF